MQIITDTREQLPYDFQGYADVEVIRAGLLAGDYSIPGCEHLAAVERKTLDDLIGCFMGKDRERFARELARLRPYIVKAVVVESTLVDVARGRYTSNMKPQSAMQSVIAMQVRRQGSVYVLWRNKRSRLFCFVLAGRDLPRSNRVRRVCALNHGKCERAHC